MDMHPISLFDQIVLKPSRDKQLEFSSNLILREKQENLIVRAIHILEEFLGTKIQIRIELRKTVPIGAGLGGGSANAAGILVVLNHIFSLGLTDNHLINLALELGADVPFFISPKSSLVKGIGEILVPTEAFDSNFYLLLLVPNFEISTSSAYKNCNISGRKELLQSYTKKELSKVSFSENDFWLWASKEYTVLNSAAEVFSNCGAVCTGMSGSGSTLFAVFSKKEERDYIWTELCNHNTWNYYPCNLLNEYSYRPIYLNI